MAEDLYPGIKIKFSNGVVGCFAWASEKPDESVARLKQVHGCQGFEATKELSPEQEGDWIWTSEKKRRVGVTVADCTAILVAGTDKDGKTFVSAIHAGWRGTAAGVIEKAIAILRPKKFEAWLSPSICQEHFEVGADVLSAFGSAALRYSKPGKGGKYLLNLKGIQMGKLQGLGGSIRSSSLCTSCQKDFVSYRQTGAKLTARHLAWIEIKN